MSGGPDFQSNSPAFTQLGEADGSIIAQVDPRTDIMKLLEQGALGPLLSILQNPGQIAQGINQISGNVPGSAPGGNNPFAALFQQQQGLRQHLFGGAGQNPFQGLFQSSPAIGPGQAELFGGTAPTGPTLPPDPNTPPITPGGHRAEWTAYRSGTQRSSTRSRPRGQTPRQTTRAGSYCSCVSWPGWT